MSYTKWSLTKQLLCIGICLGSTPLFSQTKEDLAKYKEKYKGYNYIQKLNKESIRLDLVNGIPKHKSTITTEYVVLNNQGAMALSEETLEFSEFEKIDNIDAYALEMRDKGPKKITVSDFRTKDVENNGMIFHDGTKETSFLYQGLAEGSLRYLSYENSVSQYRFPMGFSFFSVVPIENSIFEIDHDTCIHLSKIDYNLEGTNVVFSEKIVKNRRIWTWTCNESKAFKFETNAPNPRYFEPYVFSQISHYYYKNKRTNVLGSLDDLFAWYKESIQDAVNEQPSEDLVNLVKEITKDQTTEFDKVKAVYYWVQNNIKYIAFEEGMGGFVPRKPSFVFTKRYGDCKDMATLIHIMLKTVNIKSSLAWIGSRDIPFKYSDFPSSIVDNHMIAVYFKDNAPYFLDATSSFQPIEYPTSFILGKEAFLYKGPDEYQLVNVTIPAPQKTLMIDTARIQIDNKKITGHSSTKIVGYYNVLLNENFKDVPLEKMDETMMGYVRKGNNTFSIKKSAVKNVSERDKDFYMDYDFEVENYVTTIGKEYYVNMILEKEITSETEIKETRKCPFEQDFLSSDSYTVVLDIPKNTKVKSIPKNVSYQSDFVDFSIEYKVVNDQVISTLKFDMKFLLLEAKDFPKWNEFYKLMKKNMSETVVLEQNN